MSDPKTSEAARRANDPTEFDEHEVPGDERTPKIETEPLSEIEETSAEGGPELRDVAMPDGTDTPDGRRKP